MNDDRSSLDAAKRQIRREHDKNKAVIDVQSLALEACERGGSTGTGRDGRACANGRDVSGGRLAVVQKRVHRTKNGAWHVVSESGRTYALKQTDDRNEVLAWTAYGRYDSKTNPWGLRGVTADSQY